MRSSIRHSVLLVLGALLALAGLSAPGRSAEPQRPGVMPHDPRFPPSPNPNAAFHQAVMMGHPLGLVHPLPLSSVMGFLPGAPAGGPYGAAYGRMPALSGYGSSPSGAAYPGTSSVSTYSTPYQVQPRAGDAAGPSRPESATAYQRQTTAQAASVNVLDAMGVPNTDGRLDWPLGLRILPPGEKTEVLRKQIEALLRMAANHARDGKVSPQVLQEASNAIAELHDVLHEKKGAFSASYTYDEADRFLDKLAKGLKLLQ
jgi:hypothetical protein